METNAAIAIERILTTAAEYRASDLHLSPGNPPILRVDGKLLALEGEQMMTPDFVAQTASLFLDAEQQKTLEREKELIVAASLKGKLRFKMSLFHQKGSLAASLRFIPSQIRSVRELGLPTAVEQFTALSKGLVLITGPFGSGRTATLAALVQTINLGRAAHIVTIEKPIEFLYVNNRSIIEQREVGRDTVSFAQALLTASREDVDVIVVSEMEDPEVVRAVLAAAQSSRLVISTMNTDSVLKTIETILYSFPQDEQEKVRLQLSETLEGIVSQRLLPRVGGGRVVVAEILTPTPPVRSVIRDGALFQLNTILQTSREAGMASLDRSLAELVKTGEILMDDALAVSVDRTNLKMMVRTY